MLDITRVNNTGIAFGLFPGRATAVSVLTVLALCAIAGALAGLVARKWSSVRRHRTPEGRLWPPSDASSTGQARGSTRNGNIGARSTGLRHQR